MYKGHYTGAMQDIITCIFYNNNTLTNQWGWIGNQEFNINKNVWQGIFLLPPKLLFDNKIYESQFKILHIRIPTNKLLQRMKKISRSTLNFHAINWKIYFIYFMSVLEDGTCSSGQYIASVSDHQGALSLHGI